MKIKILTSCSGLNFSFAPGQVTDTDSSLAKDLIKAGYAEEVKGAAKKGKIKDDGNADA